MEALLFGSIGSVIETSELQREAFNRAFAAAGLSWEWERETYRRMLSVSGGVDRIQAFAASMNADVDAQAIHARKSRIFQKLLTDNPPSLRNGVSDALDLARQHGLMTGLASTTSRANLTAALGGFKDFLDAFDIVTSSEQGFAEKPAPDVYKAVLREWDRHPSQVIAVEDNGPGLRAAADAGTNVVAFLGENTKDHDVTAAHFTARDTILPVIAGIMQTAMVEVA